MPMSPRQKGNRKVLIDVSEMMQMLQGRKRSLKNMQADEFKIQRGEKHKGARGNQKTI